MLVITEENNIDTSCESPASIAGELIPAPKRHKLPEKGFDDRYIYEYLKYPEKGKLAALTRAEHPDPTRQQAWKIHNRLADKIDRALDSLIKQDAALGRATLVSLCKSSQSDSVRAACASKLMEYADKTKPARVIHTVQSLEDIDKEIALLTSAINAKQKTAK